MLRGWPRRVVFAAAAGLATTGVAALPHIERTPSAAALLAAVHRHPAGRFSGDLVVTLPQDDNTSVTLRARVSGDMQDPKHVRMVTHSGDGFEELILSGADLFARRAPSGALLHDEPFGKFSLNEAGPSVVADGASAADFAAVLATATDPVKAGRAGDRTTLRLRVDPRKAFNGMVAQAVGKITATIVVTDDGDLVSMRERVRGDSLDMSIGLTFVDWGTRVLVATPAADNVDLTPLIEEERIAAYSASSKYMPKTLPNGWGLNEASAIAAGEDIDCDEVLLSYTPEADDPDAYVDIYEVPTACAGDLQGEPVQFGPYRGILANDDDGTYLEFQIDAKTALQIETNASTDVVERLVEELVPLDLGVTPPTAPIAQHA
jgi:hypothetical protein